MRVLTLGWEFPPHISGGLGTACHGLTCGLAHQGVEIVFVVPRVFGGEDAAHLELRSASDVAMPPPARSRAGTTERSRAGTTERSRAGSSERPRAGSSERPRVDASAGASGPESAGDVSAGARALELLAIDSPLRPYQTANSYLAEMRAYRTARSYPAEVRPTTEAGTGAPAPRARAASQAAPHAEPIASPSDGDAALESAGLTGGYGPDLVQEVGRYARAVRELARSERFDAIHAHDWMTFPAGLMAREDSGRPLFLHVHASEFDRSGECPDTRIRDVEQAGFDGADRIVCVSHYTAGMLRRHYRVDAERLRVVHNAVTQREQAERGRAARSIDDPIVLFLGRVTRQKGPDYFLDAARRVLELEPRVKFVVCGSGDLLPGTIERAARLGLARNVHFTGFLDREQVERAFALADIYVMPSVSEPFGISPLEAMALDVPVVLSRQSGVSEVLPSALRADAWDADELAGKILALLRYPALRRYVLEEGREELARLRWDRQAECMLAVYRELVP